MPAAQPLGLEVQAHLGRQLRAVFDELTHRPVPDRFIQLLDALEHKNTPRPAEESGDTPIAGSTGAKAGEA